MTFRCNILGRIMGGSKNVFCNYLIIKCDNYSNKFAYFCNYL